MGTSSTTSVRKGRTYQIELNGAVVERFRSGRSTDCSLMAASDMVDVVLVELPSSLGDDAFTSAAPYKKQLPSMRSAATGQPVGKGFVCLFGEEPPDGERFGAVYAEAYVHVALGEQSGSL